MGIAVRRAITSGVHQHLQKIAGLRETQDDAEDSIAIFWNTSTNQQQYTARKLHIMQPQAWP
jgi:hypothetical protein